MSSAGPDAEKRLLRQRFLERTRMFPPDTSSHIRDRLRACLKGHRPTTIACVWPLPGEVDLRPLCADLHGQGWSILLPETTPKGSPLIFRRWTPETPMIAGRFGTSYPDGEVVAPEIVLVPMVAFDRRGYRLGYGGGYYDRTLAGLPGARAIGYAFSGQETAEIPVGEFDIPLSMIVTEQEDIATDGTLSASRREL